MCKWLRTLLAGALIVAVAPAALADDGADDEGGTYLALGDSVAAGTRLPFDLLTEDGYPNKLFKHLKEEYGFENFINLACPADDTAEMLNGGTSDGSLCYGPGAPLELKKGEFSQLDTAVGFIASQPPGEVRLVTIVIGANDLLACNLTDPPDEINACIAAQLGQIGANLPVIIGTLQAVAPDALIVAMNYYNPNLALWLAGPGGPTLAEKSLVLTDIFNTTLEDIYAFFGVPVADVEKTFKTFKTKGGDPPKNVRATCRLTLMCEKSGSEFVLVDFNPATLVLDLDIHPTNKGHRKIFGTHAEIIDDLDTFD